MDTNLTIIERLTRARIQIQSKNSFFAYLSLYLKFKKEDNLPDWAGAGVDEKGNFHYKEEFFKNATDMEIEGIIIHEILHLSLLHLLRRKQRNPVGWNISADIVVNQIIKDNNFKLPDGVIMPDYNNEVNVFGIKIKDCNKKTAEKIYNELKGKAQKMGGKEKNKGRFDVHLEGMSGKDDKNKKGGKKGKGGIPLSESEKRELEKIWNDRTQEALTLSKMRGDTPRGIGRLVKDLHQEKINWRVLLNQYIMQQIPYNYSYNFPHKKSIAVGRYLPHLLKEKVDITIMVDLSGSIGQREYTDFMSEIIGIARAFQERIEMKVYSHDTECYDNGLISNGNIEKLKNMELKGGGGTSFEIPLKHFKEKNIKPKCLIWLTDGYGDTFAKPDFPILWVLTKGGSDDLIKDSGKVIKLEDEQKLR